ncbi:MMPL family transporter [sulfur-oxidizing endosymbiont of Gigantopelta aegis]|uniref:MMPL family transporter n=1 Tax=sulfur-oxidizing endosymbiont of Gigantopelta aegis TaxID=2794934 RepID=UPI0018DDC219|nr:MMPL family transporter [sulfur-oxidizing endosymbiont of Gigantopelta aegis]
MKHQLTQGEAGKIIIIALSSHKPTKSNSTLKLAEINKQLASELKSNKHFSTVQNGFLLANELLIQPYYEYRYLLDRQSDANFSTESLKQSFTQIQQRLQQIPSALEQKLFAEDPQMIWLGLLKQWHAQTLKKQQGVWFDQSGKQSLLFVKTQAEAFELDKQLVNIDMLTISIDKYLATENIDYIITGAPVFALASKHAISSQIKYISLLASLLLFIFLYWFFRSSKLIVLTFLPLGFAILSSMTCVILLDGFIHGISIAFGITLIGIAVDYPVHFYSHLLYAVDKNKQPPNPNNAIKSIWPLLRLGLLTTLVGFSALVLSDFSGLQQLGVFAISGLFAAAMFTRFILPLVPIKHPTPSISSFNYLLKLLKRPLPAILYPLAIFLPLLASGYIYSQSDRLWQQDLSALSPIPEELKRQDFNLREAMGLPELRHAIILQADTIEQLLQRSEVLKPHLNQLKKQGIISGYDMANHYLPSIKFQLEQQQNLPDKKVLLTHLNAALSQSPLSIAAFSSFLQAVENSKLLTPINFQKLMADDTNSNTHNIITHKVNALLLQKDNQWTGIIPLQGVNQTIELKAIQQQLSFPLLLMDLKKQTESMLSDYRNEALLWFVLGALLIVVILFIHTHNANTLFLMIWPFSAAVVLTIASLLVMDYRLSIFHLVTLLLVIGLAIDYSIFTANNTAVSQVSVIICLISTIIMFGALSFSELPILKAIGLTASLGAFYAFIIAHIFSHQQLKIYNQ